MLLQRVLEALQPWRWETLARTRERHNRETPGSTTENVHTASSSSSSTSPGVLSEEPPEVLETRWVSRYLRVSR